ncbi:TIGR03663 family protein [soil metagenome]
MNPRSTVRALGATFLRGPLLRAPSQTTGGLLEQRPLTRTGLPKADATEPHSSSGFRIHITIESMLYAVIGLLAILTRLWDLTYKAQHHDESLHSYYSWLLYAGEGYIHDPMMHGPGLFHSNALAYFLFGDSEYTTRIVPALLGIAIVLLPALLRGPQLLGKWGALACSTLLLFSPTILFYTRFNRHDPYVLFCTLVIIFSMLRFMEKRESKWIIAVWLTTGFLFTTLEVSFIIGFMLVTFVGLIMAWQIHRSLLGIAALALVALGAVWVGMPRIGVSPLPGIPWEDPTPENIQAFSFDLASHPTILTMLGTVALAIAAVVIVLNRIRDGQGWFDGVLGRTGEQTTTRVMYDGLRDRKGMWFGLGGGTIIFVALYTTLFTNWIGLGSGTVGALGYWLGQQDVQRGDQPWFYYFLILPQYELIAVLLAPVAGILTMKRIIPALREGRPVGRRNYVWSLFLWWTLIHLAVFSWAGEKMPWLSVHMALPMILLSGALIGDTIERLEARARSGILPARGALAVGLSIPVVCASWFMLWAWGSAGPWVTVEQQVTRAVRPQITDNPWLLYLPVLAIIGVLGWGMFKLGGRAAFAVGGLSIVGILLIAQLHVAYRMTFNEGDVPRDQLIYVQSSPDVTQAVEDVGELSRTLTGGLDMPIFYDSGTSWPMQWYLRNYTSRRFFGSELSTPPDAPVVFIANEHLTDANRAMLSGYTGQEYAMRWWFPEEATYRRFAIAPELNKEWRQNYQTDAEGPYSFTDVAASVFSSIWSMREPEQQLEKFRLIAFRELPAPIESYNFQVFIRNDLVPTFNTIRY